MLNYFQKSRFVFGSLKKSTKRKSLGDIIKISSKYTTNVKKNIDFFQDLFNILFNIMSLNLFENPVKIWYFENILNGTSCYLRYLERSLVIEFYFIFIQSKLLTKTFIYIVEDFKRTKTKKNKEKKQQTLISKLSKQKVGS
jgi:hypothetical protein